MSSLQEQLLKAGLADKKTAKQARTEKRKKQKIKQKNKQAVVDEATLAAQRAAAEKKERDRALNEEKNKALELRSIAAQVRQLIDTNRQPKGNGDTVLNFTHDNVIKRMYVSKQVHTQVTQARLAVVSFDDGYELVPTPVAEKIAQRAPESVVYCATFESDNPEEQNEDDWYADYQIPDDLTW